MYVIEGVFLIGLRFRVLSSINAFSMEGIKEKSGFTLSQS